MHYFIANKLEPDFRYYREKLRNERHHENERAFSFGLTTIPD